MLACLFLLSISVILVYELVTKYIKCSIVSTTILLMYLTEKKALPTIMVVSLLLLASMFYFFIQRVCQEFNVIFLRYLMIKYIMFRRNHFQHLS